MFVAYFLAMLAFKVWQSAFEGLLRIRFYTHHSKCSQCIKHRLIIKNLDIVSLLEKPNMRCYNATSIDNTETVNNIGPVGPVLVYQQLHWENVRSL